MPTFNALMREAGVNISSVRLVRHQETCQGRTPYTLWRKQDESFERYQSIQSIGRFYDAGTIASFVVNHARETLFVGLYEIIEKYVNTAEEFSALTRNWAPPGSVTVYRMRIRDELKTLSGRLIVDWGAGTRSWVQLAERQNKLILAIDRSVSEPPFPGFTNFSWKSDDLLAVPVSWQAHLASTRGVYLLVCNNNGEQYVGSAYGQKGFWERWLSYAANGHGGNLLLKERGKSSYNVTILETARSSDSPDDIIAREQHWKLKLGSRAHGLNAN